jgi:hypothetical protein
MTTNAAKMAGLVTVDTPAGQIVVASSGNVSITGNLTTAGRITSPNQPFFMGRPSVDYSGGSAPTAVIGIEALYNNGGHFNASNNRFTAPVTGWYRTTWGGLQLFPLVTSLQVNGARTYNGNHYNTGPNYITMTQTVVRQLTAGDFLTVESWNGGGYYRDWWLWSVELIG